MYCLFLQIKIIIFNCAKVEPNIICHEKGGQIPLGYADKCWLSSPSIKKHLKKKKNEKNEIRKKKIRNG